MTYDDVINAVVNGLARPNDTYIREVVPVRLHQAIDIIERYWDWKYQIAELQFSLAEGEYHYTYQDEYRTVKKVSSDIYNITDDKLIKYKNFDWRRITKTGVPVWFCFSYDKAIYFNAKMDKNRDFSALVRVYNTDYSNHPLIIQFPFMLVDYAIMQCKKDFIGLPNSNYTLEIWLNELKVANSMVEKYNESDKDSTPAIVPVVINVRRYL